MRVVAIGAAVLVAFGALLAGIHHETNEWKGGLPACATEDSTGCYWDAQLHGNGKGHSFRIDEQGRVTYK